MHTRPKIPPLRNPLRGLLFLFCSLASTAYAANGIDLALQFSRTELELEANSSVYPARLTQIKVLMYELDHHSLELGLISGIGFLSLDNDGHSAGLGFSGHHLGATARRYFGINPRLGLQAHYLLQQLDASRNTDNIGIDWHEWQASSNLRLDLSPQWGIIMGIATGGVDMERRISGSVSVNHSLNMNLRQNTYGFVEMEMLSAPAGRISLILEGGGRQGIGLNFARLF